MKKQIFVGCGTAMCTPFKNGKIDFDSFEKNIEFQIENNIDALIINGTTGESSTLSDDERKSIINFAVKKSMGRVPVIAGCGCNNTEYSILLSKYAESVGCDGILLVTPYYNKANDEGLYLHYKSIAESVKTPILLYNVPSRTGVNIPISVYKKLSEIENIVGVKEASSSISQAENIISNCKDNLSIYSGNDDMIVPILSIGGIGVISVLSNIYPKECSMICHDYFGGNINRAREKQLEFLPLINALFSEVNPIPIKAAMAHLGMLKEEYRLPLYKMSEEKREHLFSLLR